MGELSKFAQRRATMKIQFRINHSERSTSEYALEKKDGAYFGQVIYQGGYNDYGYNKFTSLEEIVTHIGKDLPLIQCENEDMKNFLHDVSEFTNNMYQLQNVKPARFVTAYNYSETNSKDGHFSKEEYTFDNGLVLVEEEKKERNGWHEFQQNVIGNGLTRKLCYWKYGLENKNDELKMSYVLNLLEVKSHYDRDTEAHNRLAKLSSLSVSSQTLLAREMPYLVA